VPAGHVLGEPVVKTKHLSTNWTHVGEILAVTGGGGGGGAGGGWGTRGGALGCWGGGGLGRVVNSCDWGLGGICLSLVC